MEALGFLSISVITAFWQQKARRPLSILIAIGTFLITTFQIICALIYFSYFLIYGSTFATADFLPFVQTHLSEAIGFLKSFISVKTFCLGVILLLVLFVPTITLLVRNIKNGGMSSAKWPKWIIALSVLLFAAGIINVRHWIPRSFPVLDYQLSQAYIHSIRDAKKLHTINATKLVLANGINNTLASRVPGTVLLVIGESETSDLMTAFTPSLPVDTTPWLTSEKENKDFYLFNHAYTNFPATAGALSMALTGINQYNEKEIGQVVTLLDVAKKAGYDTWWISNHRQLGAGNPSRSLQVSDFLIKKERFYRSFLIRFVLPTCYKLKEFNYPIVYCHVYCIILLDSITYDFGSHGVLRMGTIISKKHGDRKYYYYVESARVNGNPRIVKQVYLGNADTILSKCKGQNESLQERALCSKIYSFGDVALLYSVARRAGIVPHIDTVLPKRGQGASIGTYLLVEAINRAVAPSSTVGLEKWYSSTCLPNFTGYTSRTFTPQNFWNNTCISAEELERADRSILSLLLSRYNLDTSHLIYDATNFFTYLNTNNPAALGQRGHSKEKRTNLKIVGLGVMIAADSGMPLLFDTYPGNRPDTKEFSVMLEKMMDRYTDIAGKKPELTVTFDRGNNSLENIRFLEQCSYPIHYVGGLTRQQMGALFDIPVDEYEPLADDRLSGCSAYRTKKVVFGREYTVVLVHNPKLMEGQLQGIRANIVKTDTKLSELQKNLLKRAAGRLKGGKTPTKESVTTKIESVLKAEYMRDIFDYAVTTDEAGHILLSYAQKENGLDDLCHKYLGKVALFTDNDQFSNERVVLSYRGAWKIESAFRQMKDISHLSVRPIFHWTDEKIRVHLFSCMLAYRLCIMAQLELKEKGISLSVQQMLEEMGNMKRVLTLFQDNKDIQYVNTYSQCSETADKVCEIMHLKDEFLTRG